MQQINCLFLFTWESLLWPIWAPSRSLRRGRRPFLACLWPPGSLTCLSCRTAPASRVSASPSRYCFVLHFFLSRSHPWRKTAEELYCYYVYQQRFFWPLPQPKKLEMKKEPVVSKLKTVWKRQKDNSLYRAGVLVARAALKKADTCHSITNSRSSSFYIFPNLNDF